LNYEVLVHRKTLLLLSVIAVASSAPALGQTPPTPQQPTQPPVQTPAAQTPSMPAYNQAPTPAPAQVPAQQPAQQPPQQPPATIGPPTPGGPPVVVPGQTTPTAPVAAEPPYQPYGIPDEDRLHEALGSTYIPVDSWIYGAMTRLYSLGFADSMFLSMRPYTRQSLLHILEATEDDIRNSDDEEAQQIYTAVMSELQYESSNSGTVGRGAVYGIESYYGRALGISGQTLRDSYHLGQSISNDYGRPYEPGFNSLLGFSTVDEWGRFSLYVRGEYQHAASGTGYSTPVALELSQIVDQIPEPNGPIVQPIIPWGNLPAANPFRLVEATLSFHWLGNEISGGKSDAWLGPAQGGALACSNNAENIFSFRINRVEPLHIPFLSRFLGPMRYDFFYGSLKGHTAPNDDWTHSEMFSFRPSPNFEFGFQRTIVFGGHGHEPVTLHTFLKGFFNLTDTTTAEKYSRDDPGARFSAFNMSYRLPYMRKYVTFYVDSIVHDDVTPPSAPRRAMFRTGLYLAQIPGARKFDFRVEAIDTDPITSRSTGGEFLYFETVQRQAYTNQGFIMGDWIGREAKGGQAWLTYHLSGKEMIQLNYTNKKNDKDFIPGAFNPATNTFNPLGGTTQNDVKISVLKRLMHDQLELNGWFQYEKWNAPIYKSGQQSDTATAFQVTYFPGLKNKKLD
jgi:hypothetical protein